MEARPIPALPWSPATERGRIKLTRPITEQDLVDGILKWTVTDYHGHDEVVPILRGQGGGLFLRDANGGDMYEITEWEGSLDEIELTRVGDSPESLISVEFPAVIAPQGDVQVFKDHFGYELATGSLSKVYVRINKPWIGDDSGWSVGTLDMENAAFAANSPADGSGTYNFNLWVDWISEERNTPYEAGQMVEVTYGAGGALDITQYETDFEKPFYLDGYEILDAYETLKPNMEPAEIGENGAPIGYLEKNSENTRIFFTQDGVNAIGGMVASNNNIEILTDGSLATNSVLNTVQKSSEVSIGVKIKILKTGKIQVLYGQWGSSFPVLNITKANYENAIIGDSAPLFINKEL